MLENERLKQGQEKFKQTKNDEDSLMVIENVNEYIESMYENILTLCKKEQAEIYDLKSLKYVDIELKIEQNKKQNCQYVPKKMPIDCIKQKEELKLEQNFFIGSNPGLFYSKNMSFDQMGIKSHEKLASIGFLLSVQTSQKQIKNKMNENSLQISGDTLYDIVTVENSFIDQNQGQKNKVNSKEKVSTQTKNIHSRIKNHIPQNRRSNHSKYCQSTVISIKKQKDFVVPVIKNESHHNKSRIKDHQYFHINDKNLNNFFVTKNKRKYVDQFTNTTGIKNYDTLVKSSFFQHSPSKDKKFRKSHMKKLMNTCRDSSASNPNFTQNYNQQTLQDSFGMSSPVNTKFLIKVLPSDKMKKLFNQSNSTFINYNYRPVTCKKYAEGNLLPLSTKQNIFSSVLKQNQHNFQKNNQEDMKDNKSCDDIAYKNSFKRMNDNTKRQKKTKFSQKTEKQQKSLFIDENKLRSVIHFNKQNDQFPSTGKQPSKYVAYQIQKQLTENAQINKNKNIKSTVTVTTKSPSNKHKNFTEMELQTIKNNNIKRFKKFTKTANQKLNIVTKMGVKIMTN